MLVGNVVGELRAADHLDAGPREVHHKQDMVTVMVATVQARLDEHVVGEVVGGDVPLDAVDDVVVAVTTSGGLQRRDVRAGELLGDRIGLVLLTPYSREQPALQLIIGSDISPPLRRGVHHPGQRVGGPAGLLLNQNLLQRGESRPAHRCGHVGGIQTQFDGSMVMLVGEFLRKVATGHFGLDFIGDEAVDECLGSIPDLYVLGCQPVHRQRSPTSID